MMSKYFEESYSLLEDAFILSLTDINTYKEIINRDIIRVKYVKCVKKTLRITLR